MAQDVMELARKLKRLGDKIQAVLDFDDVERYEELLKTGGGVDALVRALLATAATIADLRRQLEAVDHDLGMEIKKRQDAEGQLEAVARERDALALFIDVHFGKGAAEIALALPPAGDGGVG